MNNQDLPPNDEFSRQVSLPATSLFREFIAFLKHNKKWWLLPIVLVMLMFGVLLVMSSSIAAPFIYTLF